MHYFQNSRAKMAYIFFIMLLNIKVLLFISWLDSKLGLFFTRPIGWTKRPDITLCSGKLGRAFVTFLALLIRKILLHPWLEQQHASSACSVSKMHKFNRWYSLLTLKSYLLRLLSAPFMWLGCVATTKEHNDCFVYLLHSIAASLTLNCCKKNKNQTLDMKVWENIKYL